MEQLKEFPEEGCFYAKAFVPLLVKYLESLGGVPNSTYSLKPENIAGVAWGLDNQKRVYYWYLKGQGSKKPRYTYEQLQPFLTQPEQASFKVGDVFECKKDYYSFKKGYYYSINALGPNNSFCLNDTNFDRWFSTLGGFYTFFKPVGNQIPTNVAKDFHFKAGEYVVLLRAQAHGGWPSMLNNYCYLLKEDCSKTRFSVVRCSYNEKSDRWYDPDVSTPRLLVRAATKEEITEYKRLQKPFDVTEFAKNKPNQHGLEVGMPVTAKQLNDWCNKGKKRYYHGWKEFSDFISNRVIESFIRVDNTDCFIPSGCAEGVYIKSEGFLDFINSTKVEKYVKIDNISDFLTANTVAALRAGCTNYKVGKMLPRNAICKVLSEVENIIGLDFYGDHYVISKKGVVSATSSEFKAQEKVKKIMDMLKPGKYYWSNNPNYKLGYIWIFDKMPHMGYIDTLGKLLIDKKDFVKTLGLGLNDQHWENLREATEDEIKWFNECRRANLFLPVSCIEEKQVEFQVGKWYKVTNSFTSAYRLCSSAKLSGTSMEYSEAISNGTYHKGPGTCSIEGNRLQLMEDLTEIQEYLPAGHVDKKYQPKVDDYVVIIKGKSGDSVKYEGKCKKVTEVATSFIRIEGGSTGLHVGQTFTLGDNPVEFRKALNHEIPSSDKPIEWKVGDAFEVIKDNPSGSLLRKGKVYHIYSITETGSLCARDLANVNMRMDCGSVMVRDIKKPETVKAVESWSVGTYVVATEDIKGKKIRGGDITKGSVDTIAHEWGSEDDTIGISTSGKVLPKSSFKWFATKEEADQYAKTLTVLSNDELLKMAIEKYPVGTVYKVKYKKENVKVKGTLKLCRSREHKPFITDGWGGAVYEDGEWAEIVSTPSGHVSERLKNNWSKSVKVNDSIISDQGWKALVTKVTDDRVDLFYTQKEYGGSYPIKDFYAKFRLTDVVKIPGENRMKWDRLVKVGDKLSHSQSTLSNNFMGTVVSIDLTVNRIRVELTISKATLSYKQEEFYNEYALFQEQIPEVIKAKPLCVLSGISELIVQPGDYVRWNEAADTSLIYNRTYQIHTIVDHLGNTNTYSKEFDWSDFWITISKDNSLIQRRGKYFESCENPLGHINPNRSGTIKLSHLDDTANQSKLIIDKSKIDEFKEKWGLNAHDMFEGKPSPYNSDIVVVDHLCHFGDGVDYERIKSKLSNPHRLFERPTRPEDAFVPLRGQSNLCHEILEPVLHDTVNDTVKDSSIQSILDLLDKQFPVKQVVTEKVEPLKLYTLKSII